MIMIEKVSKTVFVLENKMKKKSKLKEIKVILEY